MNGNKPAWKPVPVTVQDMSDFIRRSMSEPEVRQSGSTTIYWYPILKKVKYIFYITNFIGVRKISYPKSLNAVDNAIIVVNTLGPDPLEHTSMSVCNVHNDELWITTDSKNPVAADVAVEGFLDTRPW